MEQDLPLSAAQLGVWYALKSGVPADAYNIGEYNDIAGAMDPALFDAALHHVVDETESLRVHFVERDDGPRQRVEPSPAWHMTYQDLGADADPMAAVVAWMHADMAQRPDLRRGPWFAYALFKIGPERFLWHVRYHHLVMDAFGAWLVARRVAEVYSALVAGTAVARAPGSLAALVAEDAAYRSSAHFQADRQFWADAMAGGPEPPGLGAPTAAAGPILRRTTALPAPLVARLARLGKRLDLTLPQLLTLAAAIFIHRLTEAEDVVLGLYMAARMSPLARQTPAMMRNALPLRLDIRSDMPVAAVAAQTRRRMRAVMRHQRYGIGDLRRDLRRIDRPMIRQLISIRPFATDVRFAGSPATTCTLATGPVDDLDIHAVVGQSEQEPWRIEFEASAARHDDAAMVRLQRRFLQLLAAMDDPAELVGRLDILPPDERHQVLAGWNDTRRAYPADQQVHDLFAQQARRTPDRVAALYEGQQLTYRELDERAERLAAKLSALGVGPDGLVALHVERSLGMLVGLLGILKAGGAYVPLDPAYPQDRLAFVLKDCRPLVLLTQQSLRERLEPGSAVVLCLDAPPDRLEAGPVQQAGMQQAGNLACVLYTSGSTGLPKGAQIPHRALVNFLTAMQREPGIAADDSVLAITSLSFDIAGLELYLPLIVGARVTIAPADIAAHGARLAALMRASGATLMQATPLTWRLLLEAGWQGSPDLKILCGGEAWPVELASALLPRCASLWNMYGPTETTVWSAVARIEPGQRVLIGRPIANTTLYVLDRYGELAPVGVPGELFIGGDGVALGYLNRPELTRERFVGDPFGSGPAARMYRTGDRVRRLPDGRLEFLGRFDHQVKIRGFRIEPGEIEAVLRLHPEVDEAVVVPREDKSGETRLVAYVTAGAAGHAAPESLRELLRRKLAPSMIPSVIVPLDAFPLTANGKIDRKALPFPDDAARRETGVAHVAPRTPLEALLAGFWRDCLGVDRVGIHDNFFDLGGDSLSMLRLSLEIEAVLGQSFPLARIYDAPTIAAMADRILSGEASGSGYAPLVLLRPGTGAPPVFMIHPVGGGTMQYMPIVEAMSGDHPIYGVQAKGFEGSDVPHDRVEAMADCYAEAIARAQPHGPYLLVGMCFGGLVAMEVARRLSARGERIGVLAFLDTYQHPRYWPLHARVSYYGLRRVREALSRLRMLSRRDVAPQLAAQLGAGLRKVANRVGGRSFLRAPDFLPPRIKAVFEGGIAALETYRPTHYPGKVSYLICGYHAYEPKGPAAVWTRLIGQFDVQIVPRELLMTPGHPVHVATWLSGRIREALRQDAKPAAERRPRATAEAGQPVPSAMVAE